MERRKVVNPEQVAVLVEYFEKHGSDFQSTDRTTQGRALMRLLWDECAAVVNRHGDHRSGKDWAKYWSELKSRVKSKLMASCPGGQLTPVEERVAMLIKRTTGWDASNSENNTEEEAAPPSNSSPEVVMVRSSPFSPAKRQAPKPSPPRSTECKRRRVTTSQGTQHYYWVSRSEERRALLEEKRARLEERSARMEERRARNDQLLAEAAVQRAEAAAVQAEAMRSQAQALMNISQTLQRFVEMANKIVALDARQ